MSAAVTRVIRISSDTRIRVIERNGGVMYAYDRLRSVHGERLWCVERIEVMEVAA